MAGSLIVYPVEVFIGGALVLGLLIGSFLNVVIYRLPLHLQLSWRNEALDFLGQKPEHSGDKISLVHPHRIALTVRH